MRETNMAVAIAKPRDRFENEALLGGRAKENCLFGTVALLLLASLAALVVYVPAVSLVFGAVMLAGLVLMFMFGFYIGVNTRPWVLRHHDSGGFSDHSKAGD